MFNMYISLSLSIYIYIYIGVVLPSFHQLKFKGFSECIFGEIIVKSPYEYSGIAPLMNPTSVVHKIGLASDSNEDRGTGNGHEASTCLCPRGRSFEQNSMPSVRRRVVKRRF